MNYIHLNGVSLRSRPAAGLRCADAADAALQSVRAQIIEPDRGQNVLDDAWSSLSSGYVPSHQSGGRSGLMLPRRMDRRKIVKALSSALAAFLESAERK